MDTSRPDTASPQHRNEPPTVALPVQAPDREKIAEKSATWEKWWSGGGSNGSITGYLNWLFYKLISVIPHSVPHPSTLLRMDGDGLSENSSFDRFPAAPCAPKMPPPGFQGRFIRARINPRIWRSRSRPSDRHRLTDLDRPVCQLPRTSTREMGCCRLCCRSSITASRPRSHRRVPRRYRPYAARGRKPPMFQRPRARACSRAPVDSRAP